MLTLSEAKTTAQAIELELSALVPSPLVAAIAQTSRGSLLDCASGGSHWSGHTRVDFIGPIDTAQVLEAGARAWNARGEPWHASVEDIVEADLMLVVRGPGDSQYLMSTSSDKTYAHIDSFAPCVEVQPGEVRGPFY